MISYSANATYYAWGAQTEASASMGPYVATYGASSASGAGAVATFSTASIPAGAQAITAVYNGDSNWLGSTSAAVTQNVTPAVLTVTANNASRVYGAGKSCLHCELFGLSEWGYGCGFEWLADLHDHGHGIITGRRVPHNPCGRFTERS